MFDDSYEWVPLREGVSRVAKKYAHFMHCEPKDTVNMAWDAILDTLKYSSFISRAKYWKIHWDDNEKNEESSWGEYKSIHIVLWEMVYQAKIGLCEYDRMDWIIGEFSVYWDERKSVFDENLVIPSGYARVTGVEVCAAFLPLADHASSATVTRAAMDDPRPLQREKRGRHRKWDWEGALIAVITQANMPDGLPEGFRAHTEICKIMTEWFEQNQGGSPASSEIGSRASSILDRVNSDRK